MADGIVTEPLVTPVDPSTKRMPFPVGDSWGQLIQALKPLPVKGSTKEIRVTVPGVLAASAYAANDQIGGVFPISNIVREHGGGGRVSHVMLWETTTQQIAADIIFFKENLPAAADNAAATWTDAVARENIAGGVHITDYFSLGANAFGKSTDGFDFQCKNNENSLYAAVITRGAPTYGVGGLELIVVVIQD